MKCDEEKPSCLKCRNTGRTCDGYLWNTKRRSPINDKSPDSASNTISPPTGQLSSGVSLAKTASCPLHLGATLGTAITGTLLERQCFEYFRLHIGQELSKALMQQPTEHFVLQACHTDPAIRSAVVAIGSMGQRLRLNNMLTLENQQANSFQDFAQLQYCKALRQLRAQMINEPERSVELSIITCFLFTIFEFLVGNGCGSLIHLRSGLNILRREKSTTHSVLRQEITRIFSMLDTHATMWLGLSTFQSPAIMPDLENANQPIEGEPPGFGAPCLDDFPTLDDAAASLNYQITRMYHFRQWVTAFTTSPEEVPSKVYERQRELILELQRWPSALQVLVGRLPEATEETTHRIAVLHLNYQLTTVLLSACLDHPSHEYLQPAHSVSFRFILRLAKRLLTSPQLPRSQIYHIVRLNNRDINPVPRFSFYAGVVQPLYMVAVCCRNLEVAWEAVQLLRREPWKEGAWDSEAMAGIVERRVGQLRGKGYYLEAENIMDDWDGSSYMGLFPTAGTPFSDISAGTLIGDNQASSEDDGTCKMTDVSMNTLGALPVPQDLREHSYISPYI